MTTRGDYYACPCGWHDYAVMRRVDQGCVPDDHHYVDMPTCAKCGDELSTDAPAVGYPCDCHTAPVVEDDAKCAHCLMRAAIAKAGAA